MKLIQNKPHWFKIKNKKGEVVPFNLTRTQKEVLDTINKEIKEKGRCRKIILKARQLGMSTLTETLLLSYAMTEPAFTGYAMAHDATTANDLFDKIIKFEWQNFPDKLKELYKLKRDNTRQLMFEDYMNSSSVTVGLSARGGTVDGLHVSEAGKMSMNKRLWDEFISGTLPAAASAKFILIESTADGGMGLFYELVQDALAGKNEFDVIFLNWTGAEEYQLEPPESDEWMAEYEQLAKRFNLYADPIKQFGITKAQFFWYYRQAQMLKEEVKVQYPFTIDEAFISKAQNKFDLTKVKNLQTKPPLDIVDNVKRYRDPDQKIYSLAIDPSSGLGKDYTSITMREMGEGYPLVAQMKAKVDEIQTAEIASGLANIFEQNGGKVYITCEINGNGRAVQNQLLHIYGVETMSDIEAWRFYRRFDTDPTAERNKFRGNFGWQTTSANRDVMITEFAHLFQLDKVEVLNEDEKEEMRVFIWNDERNRYEAQDGQHDDLLFSDFICIQNMKFIAKYG